MLILDFHALYMSEIEFWVNSGFTQLDQIVWHNLCHIDFTVLPLKIQSKTRETKNLLYIDFSIK